MKKLGEKLKEFWGLLKDTFESWSEREPFYNSIILSYYTIFSLPGFLIIVINLAGYFFSADTVTGQISSQISDMIGPETARDVEYIVARSNETEGTKLASLLSVATLLFGATGIFYHVQQILNKIWEVQPEPKRKLIKFVKDRLFSFGLILVIGFLMLVSLILSAGLSALSDWVAGTLSESLLVVFKVLDFIVSLGIITLLFAAMFKFLPDVKIKWRDVWVGSFVTAVLFVIAKFALGLYFGNSDPGSAYGAAGSIVLIMLWVSYTGMILLFGAEFTQVYANRYGGRVEPSEIAVSTHGESDSGAIVNKKKARYLREEKRSKHHRN